jgi:DNA polymerase-3 subunit beta
MLVTLRKEDIVDGLLQATSITPTRTGAAYLRTVWLHAENGTLTVSATDSSLEFCGTYPAEVERAGTLGAQGKYLADLVRKLPPGPMSLRANPGESVLHLTQGPRSYKLAVSDPAWYQPTTPFPQGPTAPIDGHELRHILDRILFCVADDDTLGSMTCLKITAQDEQVEFCGLDGLKIALATVEHPELAQALAPELLAPKKYLQDLRKWLPEGPVEIARQGTRLFVRTQDRRETMSLPLRDLPFYDYRNLLSSVESSYQGHVTVDREELLDSLDRIAIFATDNNYVAVFDVQQETLTVSTPGHETGAGMEPLPCQAQGQFDTFSLAARPIMDILSRFSSPQITIHFADYRSLIRITGVDDPGYSVSIMPVVIEEEVYYE